MKRVSLIGKFLRSLSRPESLPYLILALLAVLSLASRLLLMAS